MLAGVLSAAVAAAFAAVPAQAGAKQSTDSVSISSEVVRNTVADDYWTAERMRAARPGDERVRKNKGSSVARTEEEDVKTLAAEIAPKLVKEGLDAALTESMAVGKVFFEDSTGTPYLCSAATVNSNGKNMVFTAGHCVHDGDGGNWVKLETWRFMAGYHNGAPPQRQFSARTLVTLVGWARDGDSAFDDAVVVLNRNSSGQQAVDVVGGNGLQTGGAYDQFHTIFGYSSSLGGGQTQYTWQGLTGRSLVYPGEMSFQGNLPTGTSGGPWHLNYVDDTSGYGLGYIHGVTSHGNDTWNYSPYFTSEAEGNMYRAHANDVT